MGSTISSISTPALTRCWASPEAKAGDVIVLPAGTGHRRISASDDLLVVGAYPSSAGRYDEPRPGELDHRTAIRRIARVARPARDPVYGRDGPLKKAWRQRRRRRPKLA